MGPEEKLYVEISQKLGAVQSQMFGKRCLKTGTKPFASFFENSMVFKLQGDEHRQALSLNNAQLFDPSGKNRPMKEWVQIPYEHSDKWDFFAAEAMKYVAGSNRFQQT